MKNTIIRVEDVQKGDILLVGIFSDLRKIRVLNTPRKATGTAWKEYSSIKCEVFKDADISNQEVAKIMYQDLNCRRLYLLERENND